MRNGHVMPDLKQRMKALDIRVKEMAIDINMSPEHLSSIRNGRTCSYGSKVAIERYLDSKK